MQKLKLNLPQFGEILTREQLKEITGGNGSGGSGGDQRCFIKCNFDDFEYKKIADCSGYHYTDVCSDGYFHDCYCID
ncbi:hypothetical protein RYH73_13055 [Olivibacter sp. CPCC 100613]|uniref:hypothetical protein n=1 Tax=Olivibacter sp. CPCC 100613 TaxID=3079931 RepID=UPI002FF49A40